MTIDQVITNWICPTCGDTTGISVAELAEIGSPMCVYCDEEMVLEPKVTCSDVDDEDIVNRILDVF
jgi:hypothetical protein